MSKNANPGELRAPVRFYRIARTVDTDGYPAETETDVFGKAIRVKWVNAHGNEAMQAMQLQLVELATITCRYSASITVDCLIKKGDDTALYEIISIDDVENRRRWMEIKVKRMEGAR